MKLKSNDLWSNVCGLRIKSYTTNLFCKALFIFILAFIIRFIFINETSLEPDELVYVKYGRMYFQGLLNLDFSYDLWSINRTHPPVAKLLLGGSSSILLPFLGENTHNLYFSARIASVIFGSLLCLFLYLMGRRWYGESPALLAALLSAVSPWMIHNSTLAMLDIFVAFFVTLTFLSLNFVKATNKFHLLVGFFLGLALGCKGTAVGAVTGLALYSIFSIFKNRREGRRLNLKKAIVKSLTTLVTATLTFIAVWPFLWSDPFDRLKSSLIDSNVPHLIEGHPSFYAGTAYVHVPPWVSPYILFVKNPLIVFILSALFVLYIIAQVITRKPIPKRYIVLFSWLVGGILTLSAFPIIIGDHYILFLAPAVYLTASILTLDILRRAKKLKAPRWKHTNKLVIILLVSIMLAESTLGLALYRSAPGAYVNELFPQGDKAIMINDTGYDEAVEYLNDYQSKKATVATPYFPDLLSEEFRRHGIERFKVVDMSQIQDADYVIVPVKYSSRFGMPRELEGIRLIHLVKTRNTNLAYIFEAVYDAEIVSDDIPSTMIANQKYTVHVTVRNAGSNTWTRDSGYKLGSPGNSDPFAFPRVELDPSTSVGYGEIYTFTFTMIAPSTLGTYTTDWRMLREMITWFGNNLSKTITVSESSSYSAEMVSDGISTSTMAGQQYTVHVTVQNTEANTLKGAQGYKSLGQSPFPSGFKCTNSILKLRSKSHG